MQTAFDGSQDRRIPVEEVRHRLLQPSIFICHGGAHGTFSPLRLSNRQPPDGRAAPDPAEGQVREGRRRGSGEAPRVPRSVRVVPRDYSFVWQMCVNPPKQSSIEK